MTLYAKWEARHDEYCIWSVPNDDRPCDMAWSRDGERWENEFGDKVSLAGYSVIFDGGPRNGEELKPT